MKKAAGTKSFILSKLQNTQIAQIYIKQVNKIIKKQLSATPNQEEWNNIIKALKISAEKNQGYGDPNILHFLSIQKDISIKLNFIRDKKIRNY